MRPQTAQHPLVAPKANPSTQQHQRYVGSNTALGHEQHECARLERTAGGEPTVMGCRGESPRGVWVGWGRALPPTPGQKSLPALCHTPHPGRGARGASQTTQQPACPFHPLKWYGLEALHSVELAKGQQHWAHRGGNNVVRGALQTVHGPGDQTVAAILICSLPPLQRTARAPDIDR